ncbi:MAG: hypothetical protein LWW85_15265, partial [Marinilabiliales bacterium]|nr:hypothetical protein [Marinilabiliales bacterium]
TVSSKAVEVPGKFLRRDFYLNGKRIQLTGGAWVPDFLLNRDSARYEAELRLCRNANINLVRIWGGGVTPSDAFFDAADRYGMLVWSDFWVTGDTHGEFKGSTEWPLEPDIFVRNVVSTIYRIRNHASLFLWTGGNEGHVRKDVYEKMRESVVTLDGTRPYIPCSSGFAKLPEGLKASWPDNQSSGVYSSGPYSWQDSKEYYRLANHAKDWVFKDETGLPSQPPYNTLTKIIPNLVWDPKLPFPLNDSWGYHDAATGNGHYEKYYEEMVKRYGMPSSMMEFSEKMQLMNATGYQGTFEAAGSRLNDIGGIMLWKLNAAFPSVIWQVYDWYLQPNAGYYFMQNAVEPIHIQYHPLTHKILVLNRTYKSVPNLTAEARIFDLHSGLLNTQKADVRMDPSDVKEVLTLPESILNKEPICFVLLNLKDKLGKVVSRNGYWISPNNDFKGLDKMEGSKVDAILLKQEQVGDQTRLTLQFSNKSDKIAFFVHPALRVEGEDLLPAYWSANYFTLAPGETMTTTVSAAREKVNDKSCLVAVSGWNVKDQNLMIHKQ